MAKRRNLPDATARNVRASRTRDAVLAVRLDAVERRLALCEHQIAIMGRTLWPENRKR